MKNKNLRLGNIVKIKYDLLDDDGNTIWKHALGVVNGLSNDHLTFDIPFSPFTDIEASEIEPIWLTDEVIKCTNFEIDKKRLLKNRFSYNLVDYSNLGYININEYSKENGISNIAVRRYHLMPFALVNQLYELQNIIYLATGFELMIDIKKLNKTI